MSTDYDVIVVGSGAGGGTIAWRLARAGRRVLVIERGKRSIDPESFQSEHEMMFGMKGFDDRTFRVNGRDRRLFIGGILGGGTSLYGAALLRPSRLDFEPGRFYGNHIDRPEWEWPISYADLEPFYDQAERLLRIVGPDPKSFPHIESPEAGYQSPTPPLRPINKRLRDGILRAGYHPAHLPLGIDFDTCAECPTCPGYVCPTDARATTVSRLLSEMEVTGQVEIRTETEADRLLLDRTGTCRGIRVRSRSDGRANELTAETYVLSAGAIGSPALLMKSGYEDASGQLGRNYMYHCGALVAGVFTKPTEGGERFIKQLGFTDLYFGTDEYPHKLGYVQTLPSPGPLTVRDNSPVPISAGIATWLNRRMLVISGAVEDLPQRRNRIDVDRNGRIHLHHRFHSYDIERSRWYLGRLKRVMRLTGAALRIGATGEKDEVHVAHQVGTARFGHDPARSVLNADCRLHDIENLYVVDGSFMPTSLGVGPALTIMANALRVGEHIASD